MAQNRRNVLALKNSNRALILECVRCRPLSRADIGRKTGLSKSAVSMLTAEMILEGLLKEAGLSDKAGTIGRTSILVDLVGSYGYAIGVALHRRRIGVCAVNVKTDRLFSRWMDTASFDTADAALDRIAATVREELDRLGLPWEKCLGIGVSSPGPLDRSSGVILNPPELPLFCGCPITEKLRERFGCRVYIENNAVALALLDFYRRGEPDGNVLFTVAADGIGSALLMNGRVFRGARGFAGEIGHISIDRNGEECTCGNRGCLERYATLSALKRRFGFESYEAVADAAAAGDGEGGKIVAFLVNALGTALVDSVNLYDLDRVVLFGEYAYRAEMLASRLKEWISEHSIICRVHPVAVVPSVITTADGDTAAAISALNGFCAQNGGSDLL